MGTRYLTIAVANDDVKVAQYGQYDGYPEGAGVTIFSFLKEIMTQESNLDKLKENISKCSWISNEKIKDYYMELGVDIDKEKSIPNNICNLFNEKHPELTRDTGAEILKNIYNSGPKLLKDQYDFAGDSLFCEWGYVVDLDKKILEIYEGFNEEPLNKNERFETLTDEKEESKYYPIKLAVTIPFNLISVLDEKEFINTVNEITGYVLYSQIKKKGKLLSLL